MSMNWEASQKPAITPASGMPVKYTVLGTRPRMRDQPSIPSRLPAANPAWVAKPMQAETKR